MFVPTAYLIQVKSYTCEVGSERNQFNEWKWVLPYPNLCECTRVIMGGLNTWTPIRPFVPKHYDSPLLSDDINEIREYYGLNCDEQCKFIMWMQESRMHFHDFARVFCAFKCLFRIFKGLVATLIVQIKFVCVSNQVMFMYGQVNHFTRNQWNKMAYLPIWFPVECKKVVSALLYKASRICIKF